MPRRQLLLGLAAPALAVTAVPALTAPPSASLAVHAAARQTHSFCEAACGSAAARQRAVRCGRVVCALSPAYDSTMRYAAVDWAKNLRTLPVLICASQAFGGPLPPLPPLPHQLLGSALGLLLARKQWGVVTSECRALAGHAVKSYLRGERDSRRLKALLAPSEVLALDAVVNQPQYVLARLRQLAQAARQVGVSEKEREVLLKSVGVLGECVSTCERIYNTPIPLSYSRHTSRFLIFYASTLPLAIVGAPSAERRRGPPPRALGWATVPVMATLCWALFGRLEREEEAGSGRREVCRTIRRDVRAIAQYAALAQNYSTPTIARGGPGPRREPTFELPDGFRQLRAVLATSAAVATEVSEAAKKKATGGQDACAEKVEPIERWQKPPCVTHIAAREPTFELPDGFRQLRAVLATSAAVATEVSEAAKKKATGGQDA
ncbi:hypothetical protein EMIHUDRAFT_95402 [Emiliania huxleyi CCMP1516]|uniref:Uncharacterized protein n=2 Tax=Emiliania huxleyi TaxID=2903 RepID=A0A0D3JGX6_EMIH1|nr:hypothetical protein EMIHUDRAFT_95402 [Emiliania huxleyi CCMP1516]EOD22761.1 hypothetical protein EMIHUDRAFT_95402 [Emiliania huxleyi CCMP1516]|eukprot:XP_005775190.1 hypothetical protein EMIHUDRAFT_95402 [Emiliania huxleyi CCMP1516]